MSTSLPSLVYHASPFEGVYLRPGIFCSGTQLRWDTVDENRFLYATPDKEQAVIAGLTKSIRQKYLLDRLVKKSGELTIRIKAPNALPTGLSEFKVILYAFKPTADQAWVNVDKPGSLPWKTRSTIEVFESIEKIDLTAWLGDATVAIRHTRVLLVSS